MMRSRPPLRHGASSSFGQLNAGKKSVVLDLKQATGATVARRLVAGADILVENYRPGVMQRLGLDYPALGKLKPPPDLLLDLGYGQTGPSADLPAYAPVMHASSGFDLATLAYQPGRQRPDYCGVYIADVFGRHIRVGGDRRGPAPASRDRAGTTSRRFHVREHVVTHAHGGAVGAVRGAAAPVTANLWTGGDSRRLHLHGRPPASAPSRAWQQRPAARTGSRTHDLHSTSTAAPTGGS
jgi:hypothetical protein